MKDLIDRKAGRMKLIDAPVGVFVFHDELVLKTEYMTNIDGVYIPDCYILSTGEKFWGGMKSKEDFKTKYNNLDVEVIDIMPSAQPEQLKVLANVLDGCPLTYPCDTLWSGEGWCRQHCKSGQDAPDTDCWLRYAEVVANG